MVPIWDSKIFPLLAPLKPQLQYTPGAKRSIGHICMQYSLINADAPKRIIMSKGYNNNKEVQLSKNMLEYFLLATIARCVVLSSLPLYLANNLRAFLFIIKCCLDFGCYTMWYHYTISFFLGHSWLWIMIITICRCNYYTFKWKLVLQAGYESMPRLFFDFYEATILCSELSKLREMALERIAQ